MESEGPDGEVKEPPAVLVDKYLTDWVFELAKEVNGAGHGSFSKLTFPEGLITSDADVPFTITSSVKKDGRAEQGTGIWLTLVPIVVVIVEHASAVPTACIPPLDIWTMGGAALVRYIGAKRRMAREIAISKIVRSRTRLLVLDQKVGSKGYKATHAWL